MDWVKLTILLIGAAVWILSNLAKQQNDKVPPPRVPSRPPPLPRDPLDSLDPGAKTKPEQDDKYREEMDRKREKKSTERKPIARPRPKRLEPASRLPQRPVVLAPVTPPPLPPRNVDTELRTKSADGLFQTVSAPVPGEHGAQVGAPAKPVVKPTPVSIKNMLELLKKHENLATVFLLKEVLDLPVAKRPRRRM